MEDKPNIVDLFSPEDKFDLPTDTYCILWKDDLIVNVTLDNVSIMIPIEDFLVLGRLFGVVAKKLSEPICDDCIEQDIKVAYLKLLRDDGLGVDISKEE